MGNTKKLTHVGLDGTARMVDVSSKAITMRVAMAEARVYLPAEVLQLIEGNEMQSAKGPVYQTAVIAGIIAAKKTGELIPLCHPLGLDDVNIDIELAQEELIIKSSVKVNGKTGVEMEALMAVSIAALTVYDMCKAVSHQIEIRNICLIHKSGGKSEYNREA